MLCPLVQHVRLVLSPAVFALYGDSALQVLSLLAELQLVSTFSAAFLSKFLCKHLCQHWPLLWELQPQLPDKIVLHLEIFAAPSSSLSCLAPWQASTRVLQVSLALNSSSYYLMPCSP